MDDEENAISRQVELNHAPVGTGPGRMAASKPLSGNCQARAIYLLAAVQEVYARLTGKPVLLSMATLRLLIREEHRTCFNHRKSEQDLGLSFRVLEQTIFDTVAWYRLHGRFKNNEDKNKL
jgi:hypothetical protein